MRGTTEVPGPGVAAAGGGGVDVPGEDLDLHRAATVTRLTGFNAPLLRAWERRHGLLRPRRTGGGHRLYGAEDLLVLGEVRRLLDGGLHIGEVAARGRASLLAAALRRGSGSEAAPAPSAGSEGEASGQAAAFCAELLRAAESLDTRAFERSLDAALARLGVDLALSAVVRPLSREVGERWAVGRLGVAGEHLASGVLRSRLQALLERSAARGTTVPPVLCACLPGELHENAGLLHGVHLARGGWPVVWLGASLPLESLEQACRLLSPGRVDLTVATRACFEQSRSPLVDFCRARSPRLDVRLGGGGAPQWDADLEGAGVRLGGDEDALSGGSGRPGGP